jgi:hypothetical protein
MPEASSTTSNDELARNPHAPSGFRRRAGICGAGPHARQPRVGPGRCRSSTMRAGIACVAAPGICRHGARNATHAMTRTGS